jgi:hypothetical protein
MSKFATDFIYGVALGMGFKIGWEIIGAILRALAGAVG